MRMKNPDDATSPFSIPILHSDPQDIELTVSEFVALLNQALEYAYPNVTVTGELANFRVSKNRWIYFDLKDQEATVRFFGTVYQLPGPLQDGMMLAVKGMPRLHQQYGFSVNVLSIRPVGEGSIKKAAALLQAKLEAEGLFDPARKRPIPYPPRTIGLVASAESAAYRDFIKVLGHRWGGLDIVLADTQVQGQDAPAQLSKAIEQLNQLPEPPDVLVMTRGGGSAEDLQAFNTEQVTRAIAASRIPTVVAIGHEVDISLAELAADMRASTPSNAAELLVPDRQHFLANLQADRKRLHHLVVDQLESSRLELSDNRKLITDLAKRTVSNVRQQLELKRQILQAFDPQRALQRGYALVRKQGLLVKAGSLKPNDSVTLSFADGTADATITSVFKGGKNA